MGFHEPIVSEPEHAVAVEIPEGSPKSHGAIIIIPDIEVPPLVDAERPQEKLGFQYDLVSSPLIYIRKFIGKKEKTPPRVSIYEHIWSFIAAFLGIYFTSLIQHKLVDESDYVMLIASFGATAVLIYGVPNAPLSQPRNVIGGHIVSAFVGVCVYKIFGRTHTDLNSVAEALAVSIAIVCMHITKTVHPPGGATALIAVIGTDKIHHLGFFYVITPCTTGPVLMVLVAAVVNNLSKSRQFPCRWL